MDEVLPIIPKRGRPRIYTDRDEEIYFQFLNMGKTRSELADEFWNAEGLANRFNGKRLSYRAICQIITNQGQRAQRKFQR